MDNTTMIDSQGEILKGTPLGVEQVDPMSGLTLKDLKINAKGLTQEEALYPSGPTGKIYFNENEVVPKSVYRILGDNYHPEFDPEYNAQLLSREQSNGGKALSALNQAVVGEIVGGTIEGVGYLLDLPMLFDLAEGTEQEFGNAITDFGKSIGKWAEDATPVYTDPTAAKFNPTSFEWWMKNAPSVASTISLVLPSMGGMAALKGIGKLAGITEALGNSGKYSKLFSTAFGQAVMSRHMESLMESQGVYDQGVTEAKNALYKKYADQIDKEVASLPVFTPVDPEKGPQPGQYTQEQYMADMNKIKNKWDNIVTQEASKVAAIGAANTYSKNWVLLLQDLPEYMLLNRFLNKGAKSIAKGAEEKSAEVAKFLGMNMPKFYASKTAKHMANMIGEMGEEQYQFITNEQSSDMIRNLADPEAETSLLDQLKKNYDNGEFWTNGWFGAIGAGVMQASMAGLNAKALSDAGKARVKQLTELSTLLNKLHSDYIAAEEAGDEVEMEAAKKGFVAAVGIKSEQLGNKEHLLNLIDALANDDENVLTNYEVDKSSREFFKGKKEISEELKKDINNLSTRYNDALAQAKAKGVPEKNQPSIAASIAHSNHMLEYLNEKLDQEKGKLNSMEIKGYNVATEEGEQLSDLGKQAFSVAYQKKDLQSRLKNVEKLLSKEDITPADKEKYQKTKKSIENKLVITDEIIKEISEDKTLSAEQRKTDNKLYGDLTSDTPNGIIPLGKDINNPDQKGVLDFIETQKSINSYEEAITKFKHSLDKTRAYADKLAAGAKTPAKAPDTKPVPPPEELTALDKGDFVTYTSTDGVAGRGIVEDIEYATKDTEGKDVEPSAENADNIITVQPVDEKGEKVGGLLHLSGASVIKDHKESQSVVDPALAEDDSDDLDEVLPAEGRDTGDNLKDQNRHRTNAPEKRGLIEFLSYTEYEDKEAAKGRLKKLIVRNKALDDFISDPANQQYLPDAVARYSLNFKNENFKERLAQLKKDKRISLALAEAIEEHIKSGKALTETEKKQITQQSDLFGNIAIEVELTINKKKFKGGLFMHTLEKTRKSLSNKTEEEQKNFEATYNIYAQLRKSLVTHLLNGDKVYTSGLSTNRGNPINIDKTNHPGARRNDVAKVLGVSNYKDIELFVLKSSTKSAFNQPGGDKGSYNKPQLYRDSSTVEEVSFDFSSTGSVFVKTTNTINGQPFAIKLNKSFISEDHAYILFNAFSTLAKSELETDRSGNYTGKIRKARKGGRIGRYVMPIDPHEKDPKNNSVAWNIAAGELIDLLVVQGEELTDPDNERYKYVKDLNKLSEQHMKALKNKRLFLQRGYNANGEIDGVYLCFGLTVPYGINTGSKGVLKTVDYNRINLTSKRVNKSEAAAYFNEVKLFTDWIQSNKTYAVHLENKSLHQKLNGSFLQGRSFRIGKKGLNVSPVDLVTKKYTYQTKSEIVREPGESYVEFLLKNGLVTTDMESKDGKLFTTPFLHLGTNNDPKKDFGFRVGDEPISKETETVDVNVEVPKKEGKVDIEEVSKKTKKVKGKAGKSVKSILEDEINMREKPSDKTVWEVQDLEKELAWIRKTLNLGEDEIKIEKSLAKLMLNGRQAWATFSSSGIVIFEGAETGSIYHEAYHKVSLAYFTKEEREAIYRSARQLYHMDKETYTDNQVEEKLAEEFRTFVLTKQKAAQPKLIKRIFQELYDIIKALFFRAGVRLTPTEVDKMFNQIYSGRYRFAKTLKENRKIEPRMRAVLGEDFDTINTYKDITTVTKYLARRLKEVNKVENLNKVGRIDYQKLINDIERKIEKLEDLVVDPEITDKEKNTAVKSLALLKDILGERNELHEYPKFGVWVNYINRFLGDMGITHRKSSESEDSLYEEDRRYSDLSDEESGNRIDINSKNEDYFKPVKNNALASVKFEISTLHESDEVDESMGLIGFVDGNKVWYKLLHDIIDYDNVEDMINKIRALGESQNYYPYLELADHLDNYSEDFRTQFQTTFELYKHKHLVTSFSTVSESGEVDIVFDNATHNELSRSTILRWNEELSYDRDIVEIIWDNKAEGKVREKRVNKTYFDKVLLDFKDSVHNWYVEKSNNGALELSEKDLETLFTKTSKVLSKLHIHVNTDVLRYYAYVLNKERSLQNNLFTFLNKMQSLIGPELVEDKDGLTNIISNETIRMLGEAYADVNAVEESDMVVGPEGHMIWRYGKLSLVSDNKRRIKRSAVWSRDKLNRIGNKHSRILKSFVPSDELSEDEAKANRDRFDLLTMSSFKKKGRRDKGRDYLHLNVIEDYLFKAYSILKEDILPLPVMANRGTYYLMSGVKLLGTWDKNGDISNVLKSSTETGEVVFTDEVINMFYDYYLDEKERIDTALEVKKNYESETKRLNAELKKPDADIRIIRKQLQDLKNGLIRNYHYMGNFNLNAGNAYHFIHFKGFENLKTPEEVRSKINEVLNDRLQDDIRFTNKEGIIIYEKNKESGKISLIPKKFNKAFVGLHDSMTQPDNFSMLSVLAKVMVNTQMSVFESEKIFLGDPALFKRNNPGDSSNYDTYNDAYKRWFGVGSTGTRMRVNMPGRRTTYNVSILKTQKFESLYYEPMLAKHTEWYEKMLVDRLSEADKKVPEKVKKAKEDAAQLAEEALSKGPLSYKNVDPTDGTALISPEMFKEIYDRLGLWTDKRMQQAFDLLNSDEKLTYDEILKATNIVFSPLKTMYIGHHNFNGVDLFIYNKMAMFTLFRQHVKGTHLEEVLDRMELKGRYARTNILSQVGEKLEKVHVFNFDTAVKVGSLNGMPLFVNEKTRKELTDLSQAFIFQQGFDNLKYQQVVEPHDSMKQTFGTAGFKIGSSDIIKDGDYGKEGTGEELLKKLHHSRAVLSDFGIHKVDAKFGISNGKISNKMLIELLKRDAESANKSFDFIRALKTDEKGDKYLEIDSFNDRKWIYSRIKTIVDETTIDLETPGNQLVQMTDYGMNPTADYAKELKFIRYSEDGTSINEMECRVSLRLFKTFFPKGHEITRIEAEKLLNSNPKLFGYRVPTQGQNSIFKLKIVDLLPPQTGDIIQLPLEFTTVTGSDFDIDKLYVAMHNYTYNKDEEGNIILSKVKYSTSEDEAEERYKNKMIELFNIYKNSVESFRGVLERDKYGKLEGIVSKYFGKFSEVVQMREDYQANADSYKDEETNLIAMIASINKSKESAKDPLFKIKLENDLRNAITQLESVQAKLNSIPAHMFYREILDALDWVALEEVFTESGKLPKFEDFKNLSIEEQNTKEGLQNRLLDLLFVVLSDEKHFVNMTTPLGTMTNILETKAAEYESVYNKESQISAPALYTTTPSFQSATKQKFSSSTFGIAPYALSNNHHSLTQMADVAMLTDLDLGFNKKGELDLARIMGEDNRYISWWISALIDAHVDGVNKPYITSLNVNESTHDILNLLIRSGLGEVSFDLLNQPIVREYSYAYFKTNKSFGKEANKITTIDDSDPIEFIWKYWSQIIQEKGIMTEKELELGNFYKFKLIPLPKLLNAKQFKADAEESTKETRSKEYYIRQLSLLIHLNELKKESEFLRTFVLASRIDTKKYGSNPVEILSFLNNIKKIMKAYVIRDGKRLSKFRNIERVLTYNPEYKYKEGDTFLPTLIRNGMFKIYEVLRYDSIYATPGFNAILTELTDATGSGEYSRQSMLNIMTEEIVSYFIGKFMADPVNGMGIKFNDVMDLMFTDENSMFELISNLKSGTHPSASKVKDNPFLHNLIVDFSENIIEDKNGRGVPYTFLRTPFRAKNNDLTRDEEIDGYKDLLTSDDPVLVKLAIDSYLYSYYTSAFRQRISSFSHAFPLEMNREIKYKGRIISFNSYMKNLVSKLNTPEGHLEYLAEAKREIFGNLWDTTNVAYDVDPQLTAKYTNKNDELIGVRVNLASNQIQDMRLGYNENKEAVYVPYIRVGNAFLEYIGYDRKTGAPYYAVAPKKGFGSNGYGTKGLFFYEYGIRSSKGDNKSLLLSNQQVSDYATTEEMKDKIIKHITSKGEAEFFAEVPLKAQIVTEKDSPTSDGFEIIDEADILRRQQAEDEENNKRQMRKNVLNRHAYSTREYENDEAANRENSDLKGSLNNLTTYDNPIFIDVDGSNNPTNGLGAGAYAEFMGKKYFMRRNDENIKTFLNAALKMKGYPEATKITNPEAELYALLVVLDTFKNTSEHVYINQDYSTLMYFVNTPGVAINPNEINKSRLDFVQFMPDPNKPNMVVLIDMLQSRINQIRNNGGSVRLKYIPSKSTTNNRLVDKIAKGEHTIKDKRNDFADEKWGNPMLPIANTTNNDSKEADENNTKCK